MANKEILARVKHKRDTSSNWTQNNPVLLNGEIILVDTAEGELRAKVGDGVKTYTQLPFSDEALRSLINNNKVTVDDVLSTDSTNPVQNKIVTTEINGIKTLVGDTSVAEQINTAISSKVEASDAITGLSVSGQTVTYTKGDGSTGTITTQDTQVNREPITTNADYPILLSRLSVNSTVDTTAVINRNIKANPFEGSIYVKRLEVYGTAKADGAYAGGLGSFANNIYSFAHGQNASASNTAAFSHGNSTDASGAYSHAEGDDTTASGTASHAEGYKTTASRHYSHAEGDQTTAGGSSSHAEGTGTTTSGEGAHAEGYYTIAQGNYSHVQGKYNVADFGNDYAHIVGNGTSDDARANAHTLDWDGNAWFAGNIKVGGAGYSDSNAKAIATQEYVDSNHPTVDDVLSNTSTNAVQNKVVNSAIENLQALIGDTSVANQIAAAVQAMLPKVTTITLGTNWTGTTSPYYQDVTLSCATETSIIDLQPTPTQLSEWQDAGLAFTTQSGDSTVRVYVAGSKPTAEISVQVKVQEVVQV